jgi:predicted AAA+ superfamily ATPase
MSLKLNLPTLLRGESFKKFVESGRARTIIEKCLLFLIENTNQSYSGKELVRELGLPDRCSLSNAISVLSKNGLIEVTEAKYDPTTKREVSGYAAVLSNKDQAEC